MPSQNRRAVQLEKYSEQRLFAEYGIRFPEFERMLKEQNEVCIICGEKETMRDHFSKELKKLSVDHNHTTKKIRGLLCHACNSMIGFSLDDPEILLKGAEYLEKHEGVNEP